MTDEAVSFSLASSKSTHFKKDNFTFSQFSA